MEIWTISNPNEKAEMLTVYPWAFLFWDLGSPEPPFRQKFTDSFL